jgi:hypothetical protein
VPICAGEDGFFGTCLRACGARKKIDVNIVVEHVAPGTLLEYWRARKGRGKGSPQVRRFIHKWSIGKIVGWALLRITQTSVFFLSVFPILVIAWRASRYSRYGRRDFLCFAAAWLIEHLAFHVGEWGSIIEIVKAERGGEARGYAT